MSNILHKIFVMFICIELTIICSSVNANVTTPVIIGPEDNVTVSTSSITIKWHPLDEGQWCQIQISEDPTFSILLVDEDNIFSTEWTYGPLSQDGRKYFWRIRTCQYELREDNEGEVSTLDAQARLLQERFESSDIDGDEQLSFDEANAVIQGLTEQQFNDLDQNGDGFLNREELGNDSDDQSGCFCQKSMEGKNFKNYLGDWLLVGLSLLVLLSIASIRKLS